MKWHQTRMFTDLEWWCLKDPSAPTEPGTKLLRMEFGLSWTSQFTGWFGLMLMGVYDRRFLPSGFYLEEWTVKETPYGVCIFMRATNGQTSVKTSFRDFSKQAVMKTMREALRHGHAEWRDCENSPNVVKRHKPATIEHPARGSRKGWGEYR